jgi:GT2 family glycosyltransferase
MLVRRELVEQVGPFDASFRICADYDWFLRIPKDLRSVHSSKHGHAKAEKTERDR